MDHCKQHDVIYAGDSYGSTSYANDIFRENTRYKASNVNIPSFYSSYRLIHMNVCVHYVSVMKAEYVLTVYYKYFGLYKFAYCEHISKRIQKK